MIHKKPSVEHILMRGEVIGEPPEQTAVLRAIEESCGGRSKLYNMWRQVSFTNTTLLSVSSLLEDLHTDPSLWILYESFSFFSF